MAARHPFIAGDFPTYPVVCLSTTFCGVSSLPSIGPREVNAMYFLN